MKNILRGSTDVRSTTPPDRFLADASRARSSKNETLGMLCPQDRNRFPRNALYIVVQDGERVGVVYWSFVLEGGMLL
jgi:hypothetical protein